MSPIEQMEAYILQIGGRRLNPEEPWAGMYNLTLETRAAGTLVLAPFHNKVGVGVYGRFLDTNRANTLFGNVDGRLGFFWPNPFSGKWNLLLDHTTVEQDLLQALHRHIPQRWMEEPNHDRR